MLMRTERGRREKWEMMLQELLLVGARGREIERLIVVASCPALQPKKKKEEEEICIRKHKSNF